MSDNKTPLAKGGKLKMTNKNNLPEILVKAVSLDTYTGFGDISVTTLIDAPRVRMLKKIHKPVSDASDFLWTTMGSAMHQVLEYAEYDQYEVKVLKQAQDVLTRHGAGNVSEWMEKFIKATFSDSINNDIIQEKRLSIEVNGWVLSGQFDLYNIGKKLLSDFKMTSAYSYMHKEFHEKYIKQLSIYAYMLREHGYEVEAAEIIFLFRDWSVSASRRSKDYPKTQALSMELELMSHEETEAFIKKRIALHQEVEESGVMPNCTPSEMWSTTDQYKIYKKSKGVVQKRCISGGIHPSYESAVAHRAKLERTMLDELVIKYFPAERKRCTFYCAARDFCSQYKEHLEEIGKNK